MKPDSIGIQSQYSAVNKAFSKQAEDFDTTDRSNRILQDMRAQIYRHAQSFLKPGSNILELNAGTGIDAVHFAGMGHTVHATDLSDGMIREIQKKIHANSKHRDITCQQLSFDRLYDVELPKGKFDFVFSNFGGLNCISDLTSVTRHLPTILNTGAYVTWVVMPTVCLWEIAAVLKGNFSHAFRRFAKDGAISHLEGEFFRTYYHPLRRLKNAFGESFTFIRSEGLGALSPPPHHLKFALGYPGLYNFSKRLDERVRYNFPFNRWADHIVVTFQFQQ